MVTLRRFPLRVVGRERLKSRVMRLLVDGEGTPGSLIAKCVHPGRARRSRLAVERWLPAIGLGGIAPRIFGETASRDGSRVWQLQEDLGDHALDAARATQEQLDAVVGLLARMHVRGAAHPMLAECRREGEDLGISYFVANVLDAIRGLRALRPPLFELNDEESDRRDRLLDRMIRLREEIPHRSLAFEVDGGPETFLHGDLWAANTFVVPEEGGMTARLIDWDHAGVGPASYDLSTFLIRFPREARAAILARYREEVESAGVSLPATGRLNELFDTAERARYANRVVWTVLSILWDDNDWAFDALAEVERWFEELTEVVPA